MADALDGYVARHSFARGGSKASGRSIKDLEQALAEVDGLFGALKHLDKVESASFAGSPSSTDSPSPTNNPSPIVSRDHAFLRHSHLPLPSLDPLQLPSLQ